MSQIKSNIRERISPERSAVGWPWRLFLFSLLLLATAVVLYFGLEVGYKVYLDRQIAATDTVITNLTESISQDEQEQFIAFYSQLANLQGLLDDHIITSTIFPFLERSTNKLVYFTFLDFRFKERKLSLEGIAQSYEIFSQQLEAFTRAPEVERLVVNESQSDKGQVKFRLFLTLKEELFK
ncbi:MAG: hypothetical protein ABH822_00790 [Patescibacteria group bacterium]